MVIIDEAMLRKRAEHNDKNLSNLEEISLHQSNIEGISRCVGNLCPLLKILYLQNNLIPRLENLKRLKSLQYLNVAVNNIRYIEGLDRNENLNKLDFTVNFIDVDGLLTVARLKHNFALRELYDPQHDVRPPPVHCPSACRYLTGNPCTQWEHCRAYVIAQLPQVTKLDGKNVMPSERIDAQQRLQVLPAAVLTAPRA
jgi:protein TilB